MCMFNLLHQCQMWIFMQLSHCTATSSYSRVGWVHIQEPDVKNSDGGQYSV